jgi:hypothetical protein
MQGLKLETSSASSTMTDIPQRRTSARVSQRESSNYYSTSGPSPSRHEDYASYSEQLTERTRAVQNESLDATRRTLAKIYQSEEIGSRNLQKMAHQTGIISFSQNSQVRSITTS